MATRPSGKGPQSPPAGEPPEHQDGAGAAMPAAGSGPPEEVRAPKPRKVKARRKVAAAPPPPQAEGSSAESAASQPEVLWGDKESAGADSDDEGEGDGPVLDVGSTATLASLPVPTSTASVPALRARGPRASPLDTFLNEMGRYPLLSPEEEKTLTLRYYEEQDPVALRKLVVHNLRLVVKMAYKYRRTWVSVLDLIQEGNVGLVEAVQRFDPFKGAKFSTYATFWIRAYMLRYLLEHSRTVRISRTRVGRKLFFQLARERAKLQAQGIDPGPKLLAERLGVDQAELEEVAHHMDQAEVRLDAPLTHDDATGGTILDGLANTQVASPEAEAYRKEFQEDVSAALDSFAATLNDERERAAWYDHLMAEDPQSLSELGQRFGVTKQRMGQIVNGMRKRLKQHLIDTLGTDVELGYSLGAD